MEISFFKIFADLAKAYTHALLTKAQRVDRQLSFTRILYKYPYSNEYSS